MEAGEAQGIEPGYVRDGVGVGAGLVQAREPRAPQVLVGQLRLLADRQADVAALLKTDGDHDEVLVDRITNDLVGARLVIRVALSSSPPSGGVSGAAREALERREREAEDLLRVVVAALRPWRRASGPLQG